MSFQSIQPITHDVPVEDEISLHKKGWVVQRIGWGLMFLFILLALLGLFGEGPLSSQTVQSGDVQLKYERFCRYEHGAELRLQSAGENIQTVSLPQEYLKKFQISKVVPRASRQITSPGYVNFQFEGSQNDIVTFYFNPVGRGKAGGTVKVNTHSFTISQIIYP